MPVLFFNRPDRINDELQVPSYSFNMTINFTPKNYKKEINRITIPCLVLVGEQDESFYPEKMISAFAPANFYVTAAILDSTTHLGIVNNWKTTERIKAWIKFPYSGKNATEDGIGIRQPGNSSGSKN